MNTNSLRYARVRDIPRLLGVTKWGEASDESQVPRSLSFANQ